MNRIIFISFLLILACSFLTECTQHDSTVQYVDGSEATQMTFEEITDRVGEVQKCAKCHQEEYASWLAGPHANAYKSLLAHAEHVSGSKNFSEDYREFIDLRLEDVCVACHTGKNLYESNYAGLQAENDVSKHSKEHFPNAFEFVQKRNGKGDAILSTGVDCMTCHSYGKQNVTNFSSKSEGQKGSCELIKSKFFESNQNCFACHHHQVETMERLVAESKIDDEQDCVECHQQYDENGKGTHYFYWRKDSSNLQRPKRLNIFQNIQTHVIEEQGERFIEINWINDFLPHDFSECGEAVLQIEVFSMNGEKEGSGEIRVNRKNKMKSLPSNHFREGTAGGEFIFKGTPAMTKIKIGSGEHFTLQLVGLVKPQYWSLDGELEEVFNNEVRL